MFIVSFLKGDNEEFSSMYQIWAQLFHKNNNFNLRCTFCEKKALHIKNIRAPKFWHRHGSYGWRHNVCKVYASPPPLQLFTLGITNLFSTNIGLNIVVQMSLNPRSFKTKLKPLKWLTPLKFFMNRYLMQWVENQDLGQMKLKALN